MRAAVPEERLVRILSGATFFIFFQAYMVAPLVPRLAAAFGTSEQTLGHVTHALLSNNQLVVRPWSVRWTHGKRRSSSRRA